MILKEGQRIIILYSDLKSLKSNCFDLEEYVEITEASEHLPISYGIIRKDVDYFYLINYSCNVEDVMPDESIWMCDFKGVPWDKKFKQNLTTFKLKEMLQAHNTGYTGKGVKVAILDSGVNGDHPELQGKIISQCQTNSGDMNDDVGHGTAVAGIIAGDYARYEWGEVEGIAPDAKIINIKVFDKDGDGTYSNFIRGVDKAIGHGCDLINYSGGGYASNGQAIQDIVVDIMAKHNLLLTCPSGNENRRVNSPASAHKSVCVGGMNLNFAKSSFSCYRTADGRYKPDVVSFAGDDRGEGIITATSGWLAQEQSGPTKQYRAIRGTSFACPAIAGVLAQILEARDKKLSREELEQAFAATSHIGYKTQLWGWGMPNAQALINHLKNLEGDKIGFR